MPKQHRVPLTTIEQNTVPDAGVKCRMKGKDKGGKVGKKNRHKAPSSSLSVKHQNVPCLQKAKRYSSSTTTHQEDAREKTAYGLEGARRRPVLISSWLTLPASRYGISYFLGPTITYVQQKAYMGGASSHCLPPQQQSPFEIKMQQLKFIVDSHYGRTTTSIDQNENNTKAGMSGVMGQGSAVFGLMYVREIFEPNDPEYGPFWTFGNIVANVATLSQEQVDRLQLVIFDAHRYQIMVQLIQYYERTLMVFSPGAAILEYYSKAFRLQYTKLRDPQSKFHHLFSFTYLLHRYDGWMYHRGDRFLYRDMVKGLASRWKRLLTKYSPKDLGLDEAISMPGVYALLESFQLKLSKAAPRTVGEPRMTFAYHKK